MTLVRSVGGTDVDTDGRADLSGGASRTSARASAASTARCSPASTATVARSVLNVPGGPITEIVRLSPAFRGLTFLQLQAAGLVNSATRRGCSSRSSCRCGATVRSWPPCRRPGDPGLPREDHLAEPPGQPGDVRAAHRRPTRHSSRWRTATRRW
jgi:hypothetical protein